MKARAGVFALLVSVACGTATLLHARIISPEPGSTLDSGTVTFQFEKSDRDMLLQVGSQGLFSEDILSSEILAAGTTELTVPNLPSAMPVFVTVLRANDAGTSFRLAFAELYNADRDGDGVMDSVDAEPDRFQPVRRFEEPGYAMEILSSGRIAAIVDPVFFEAMRNGATEGQMQLTALRAFKFFRDDFDYLFVEAFQGSAPAPRFAGIHFPVQNAVEGIGRGVRDNRRIYGANERLQSAIFQTAGLSIYQGPTLHEMMHRFAAFLEAVPSVDPVHWGYSNVGGQLGGWKTGSLEDLGNGEYRAKNPLRDEFGFFNPNANGNIPYAPLELYLAGWIPPEEVTHEIIVANDFEWTEAFEGRFSASSLTRLSIDDIIAIDGNRVPDVSSSQKHFRVLYLLLTPEPLTSSQWAIADKAVHDFALAGDDGRENLNFWEASGGRATVQFDGLIESLDPFEFKVQSYRVTDFGILPTLDVRVNGRYGFNYRLVSGNEFPLTTEGQLRTYDGNDMLFSYFIDRDADEEFVAVEERLLDEGLLDALKTPAAAPLNAGPPPICGCGLLP